MSEVKGVEILEFELDAKWLVAESGELTYRRDQDSVVATPFLLSSNLF